MIKHLLVATLATFALLVTPSLSHAQSTSGDWWVDPNVAINGGAQGAVTNTNTTATTTNNLPMPVTASPAATIGMMIAGIVLLGGGGYFFYKQH